MRLSATQLLENKGFKVKEETAEALNGRWNAMEAMRDSIDISYLAESKMSLTHIPGGEQID